MAGNRVEWVILSGRRCGGVRGRTLRPFANGAIKLFGYEIVFAVNKNKFNDSSELRKAVETYRQSKIMSTVLYGNISKWDVSNVNDMSLLFDKINIDGDISNWNVSKVTNMEEMFHSSIFSKDIDISKWDVSNVKNMAGMFFKSRFNGDLSNWNVSNVEEMAEMFYHSTFNGDISKWNTHKVYTMSRMFSYSKFDGDISEWNTSRLQFAYKIFENSLFTGDISKWNKENIKNTYKILYNGEYPVPVNDPEQMEYVLCESFIDNEMNWDKIFTDKWFEEYLK